MSFKSDFHMHSTYSDGSLEPADLMKRFKDLEYDIVSLTDHDGIDGLNEAEAAAKALGMTFINGIELSSVITYKEAEVILGDELYEKVWGEMDSNSEDTAMELHILGYYFDRRDLSLQKKIEEIREARVRRNEKLISLLNEQGIDISLDECKTRPYQTYIGKPNIALTLLKKGYINSPSEAFEEGRLLCSEEAYKIEKYRLPVEEAIDLINGAKGMAVLAHPLKIRGLKSKEKELQFHVLDVLIPFLKKKGLKGIECFHPSATHEDALRLVEIGEKLHLHITEGSDFHGEEFLK